jgi:hypothetical protein
VIPKAAHTNTVVEMLEKLAVVSPCPPSAFCVASSHRKPRAIRSACPAESISVSAVIAVAVDKADGDSAPTQWPAATRSDARWLEAAASASATMVDRFKWHPSAQMPGLKSLIDVTKRHVGKNSCF